MNYCSFSHSHAYSHQFISKKEVLCNDTILNRWTKNLYSKSENSHSYDALQNINMYKMLEKSR